VMTKRSRGWWMVAASLIAFAGCGGDGSGGGRGNGQNAKPGFVGAAGALATNGGSGAVPFDPNNPTGPAMMRTRPPVAEMPCASTSIVANRVLPTVMLVVDGSGSMREGYGPIPDGGMAGGPMMPAPGQISRWQAIRDALVKADIGVVPALQGLVHFGLALYGTTPACPLPMGIVMPKLNNYDAINAGMPQGQPPGQFTPTGPALDEVVTMLPDSANFVDKVVGPQIIVLATDGDPNSCGSNDIFAGIPQTDYAPSIAAAMKAQAKHVKMYVISVGQDAAAAHLQEMANIGAGMPGNMTPGAPVYYPEDPAALAETLKTLIGAELSCDLALEGKGVMMGRECMGSTVMLNGKALECNGADGWKLTDQTHIQLQGAACAEFKDAVDASLTANFPCEVIVAI
ncbi:MAG TPA: vWA domain-containing protein, partial [Polyangiales bacterium]|nr:vWA domain-containing protein [Polyangiales bacterium]